MEIMKHESVRNFNGKEYLDNRLFIIGRTALHYAAVENNVNGALLLLKHGANIDAQDEHVCSFVR